MLKDETLRICLCKMFFMPFFGCRFILLFLVGSRLWRLPKREPSFFQSECALIVLSTCLPTFKTNTSFYLKEMEFNTLEKCLFATSLIVHCVLWASPVVTLDFEDWGWSCLVPWYAIVHTKEFCDPSICAVANNILRTPSLDFINVQSKLHLAHDPLLGLLKGGMIIWSFF